MEVIRNVKMHSQSKYEVDDFIARRPRWGVKILYGFILFIFTVIDGGCDGIEVVSEFFLILGILPVRMRRSFLVFCSG